MTSAVGNAPNPSVPSGSIGMHSLPSSPRSIVEEGRLLRVGSGAASTGEITGPEIVTRPDGIRTDAFGVKITGNEPRYEPERWNLGIGDPVQRNNNCYAYAVNDLQVDRPGKPQPGQRAGRPMDYFNREGEIDTRRLQRAIDADGRGGNISFLGNTPESTLAAPADTYIVALVVDRNDGVQDYHWYRHNPDGSWSGKSGSMPATNLDASGELVLDPRTADRNYGSGSRGTLNYTEFVGYYAVRVGAEVGPR